MMRFLKKLGKDKRGNAMIVAATAMPMLIGGAGLATDTIQWVLWRRELQRAADSAALAGVYAKAQSENVSTAVTADLTKGNNHTGLTLLSGYPAISYPVDTNASPTFTNAVQVELRIQKALGFSSIFIRTAPTITVTARAAMVPGLNPCAYALNNTSSASITIGGSSSTNLGCPVVSNSTGNPAVVTNGNTYSFTADKLAAAGALPNPITGVTTRLPFYMQQDDPFANKYPTSIPSDCTTKNLQQNTYSTGTGAAKVDHLYSYETNKRCYNAFKFTGGTFYMDAGTYYLDSADFDTTGGCTLIGTGVTIILTGTTPGVLKMNGSATVQLTAPTTGTYAKMLFIQSSSAALDNESNISGDGSSYFDGAFYLPRSDVEFSGNSSAETKCAMVVGWKLLFSGNTNLQNNTSGCTANTTGSAKTIKLIA